MQVNESFEGLANWGLCFVQAPHCRSCLHWGAHTAQLRIQVVDETDRLLRQSYQNWLPHVVEATARAPPGSADPSAGRVGLAGACASRVVKVVASATLTRDPSKIERLALHCPRYLALSTADHRCGPGLRLALSASLAWSVERQADIEFWWVYGHVLYYNIVYADSDNEYCQKR